MGDILILQDAPGRAPGAACLRLFSANPELLSWAEIRRGRSPSEILRRFWGLRCRKIAIVVPDLSLMKRPLLHKLLLSVAPAKERFLADQAGDVEPVSRFLLVRDAFRFLAELLLAPFCVLGAYLLALGLRFSRVPPARRVEIRGGRIAYLRVHFFHAEFGGTLAHTRGIVDALRQMGCEVLWIASDRPSGLETVPEILRVPPSQFLRDLPEIQEIAYSVTVALRAWPFLKSRRPVALYQRHAGFSLAGLLLARLLRVPFILEFNSSDCQRIRLWAERKCRFLHLLRLVEQVNAAGADLVVTVSEPLKRYLLGLPGVDPNRVLVQPNGADPARFHPDIDGSPVRARYGIHALETVVGFCGTFAPYQGLDVLIRAASRIKRLGRADGIRFLLVGDGGVRHELEALADGLGASPSLVFAGPAPFPEAQSYLASCDILVSHHRLPPHKPDMEFYWSPIKVFEYMAMGKAIVASRIGQIAEVLEDGVDALLVPAGNEEALAQAILRLTGDPALRKRLGEAARRKILERYTWTKNVERIRDALR